MPRLPNLALVGASLALIAAGCGRASHHSGSGGPHGKFPVVITHLVVATSGIPSADLNRLRQNGAVLLSGPRVAFMDSGTASCAWWPKRVKVLGPTTIQIDMRINGLVSACGTGGVGFPITVKIDPRLVDVHRPVTVRVAYKVRLPGAGGVRHWTYRSVAPALG